MSLPPQLETKFQSLENRYPVLRSALIPMLLYAWDQFGYVSDDMDRRNRLRRLNLNALQVTETMAYYSMLRRKPAGKYHACRSADILPACCAAATRCMNSCSRKLEIGHKETTHDGTHSHSRKWNA